MIDCPPEFQVFVKLTVRAQRAVFFQFVLVPVLQAEYFGGQSQQRCRVSKTLSHSGVHSPELTFLPVQALYFFVSCIFSIKQAFIYFLVLL